MRTAETTYEPPPSGKWAEACVLEQNGRLRQMHKAPHVLPTDKSDGLLPVFANHGRWIVQCPCGSAQVASETDTRFFCCECHNEAAGGEWLGISWPKNRPAIEALLEKRPPENQNWRVGETTSTLRAENKLMGLAGDGDQS